jgi:hypothetical protein
MLCGVVRLAGHVRGLCGRKCGRFLCGICAVESSFTWSPKPAESERLRLLGPADSDSMVARSIMIGLFHLGELQEELTRYFKKLPEPKRVPRIAGIVFCKARSITGQKEVDPNLGYFGYRSGDHVNFYLAGYNWERTTESGERIWYFNNPEFNQVRKEMEACTTWKYSGGTDLILLNARFDAKGQTASVDFGSPEVFVLERLVRTGGIESVQMFFEEIFRYCEEHFDTKPAANPEQASAQHLRRTLIKPHEPEFRAADEGANLQKRLEEILRKFEAMGVAMLNTTASAEAVAETFKEATQPLRDMYKEERSCRAKAEAIKNGVPDWLVDRIVGEWLTRKFPTVDGLYKSLITF